MDIAVIGKNSIKIKGRQACFVVDPDPRIPKTSADAVILLGGKEEIDTSRVSDLRVTISGPGGYEVGGAKISGIATAQGTIYRINIDDVVVILGRGAESKTEGLNSCQAAVINANGDFSESFASALEPKVMVLYGDKKTESAKALGAESVTPVPKITVTKEKLPEKMEVVTLG